MNYRHAFHAGNFADVVKHAVLVRILLYLQEKPAPFRVIDCHGGAGLYDLAPGEAGREGEWQRGIARVLDARLAGPEREALAPYLDLVRSFNPDGALRRYPGSPLIAQRLLRTDDRLVACESEPSAFRDLRHSLGRDRRSKALEIDGWTALNAYIPPKERRGLVVIDPPFEQGDEFVHVLAGLDAAQRKWPGGVYLVWYPLTRRANAAPFRQRLGEMAFSRVLDVTFDLGGAAPADRLAACGLVIINPPWMLEGQLGVLLPALARAMAGDQGRGHLSWLRTENSASAS